MRRLSVSSRVRVVAAALSDLDCESKTLTLSDGSVLPYDYLVLAPGLQDQTAAALGVGAGRHEGEVAGVFPMTNLEHTQDFVKYFRSARRHAFSRASVASLARARPVLKRFLRPPFCAGSSVKPTSFCVYGHTLNAITTIRGLLDLGVPASSIVWIHRHSSNQSAWCDHDKIIHEKITKSMSRLGVKTLPNYKIASIKHHQGVLNYVVAKRQASALVSHDRLANRCCGPIAV